MIFTDENGQKIDIDDEKLKELLEKGKKKTEEYKRMKESFKGQISRIYNNKYRS